MHQIIPFKEKNNLCSNVRPLKLSWSFIFAFVGNLGIFGILDICSKILQFYFHLDFK